MPCPDCRGITIPAGDRWMCVLCGQVWTREEVERGSA